MRISLAMLIGCLTVTTVGPTIAQTLSVPKTVEAGAAFTINCPGSGKGKLTIVGLGQVLKQDVQLGAAANFPAGSLYNAGHYIAILTGNQPTETDSFDVIPATKPTELSLLAKPSRLAVSQQNGITGAVYLFDAYKNLIVTPVAVSFELTSPIEAAQIRTVTTRNGVAWAAMNSTAQQGADKFVVRAGDISNTRVIAQVPGDPCGLKMSAKPAGQQIVLETEPVKDCGGNAVPDGTIVTFTESYRGAESTVDVPLKRGIAQVEMPAHEGATITVASGVVLGNQIQWEK